MLEKASFFFNQKDDQIFDNLLAFLIHLLVTKTGLLRINLIFTRLRTHARTRAHRQNNDCGVFNQQRDTHDMNDGRTGGM